MPVFGQSLLLSRARSGSVALICCALLPTSQEDDMRCSPILTAPLLLALACDATLEPKGTSPGAQGPAPGTPIDNGDGTVTVIDPDTGQPVVGVIDPDTGEVVDPTTGQPIGSPRDPSEPAEPLADCDTPGPRMIRRLTAEQYKNTLRQLLGEGEDFPEEVVLSDPAVKGFHVDADAALVSDLTAELLMNYAERVTAWTMEKQRWKLASCSNHDAACHEQVIREFGRRAFRQDLTQSQVDTYMALFAAEESFDAGLHMVVSTMLQSPYLLYRRELGEPDPANPDQVRLTPYEIASELSYLITDSPPDDQLLDLAAEGRLSTDEELTQAANGLFWKDEAKASLTHFIHGWLEVDTLFQKAKDPEIVDLTEAMRQSMLDETSHFFVDLYENGGTIGELYSSNHTMLNQTLADFYGLGGVSGDAFQKVALDGRRATGILGHGSFLTEHALPGNSSPVQRGVMVRERLLCQDLPPVPENLDTNLDTTAVFSNNRERYEQHSSDPACYVCHQTIDPVGFAFEEYDAFGRVRTEEGGVPVDPSGELANVVAGPVPLDGLQDLSDYLAISDEARSCFIRYWSYYAYGRDEWAQKECNHDAIRAEAAESGYALRDTLLAIIHAPHFTRRVAD